MAEDYLTLQWDGVPYRLRRETDLGWLRPYGRVFYIFDEQPSGNLCFGVEGRYGRLFIKYAGARTIYYAGRPEDAIFTLQRAMPLYAPPHPALTQLLAHGPAGEGYAAVFRWRDAPMLRGPQGSVRERVRRLQLGRSLKMLDMVFDLHSALAERGYIAVDFQDSNVLIDFARDEAIVCDIDLYRRKPAVNDRGRMQGSARFLSPEEYALGAPLTESTTVYALGALAHEFFGDNMNRAAENWEGPPQLFAVAEKATAERPEDRYPSLRAFVAAWRETVGNIWVR